MLTSPVREDGVRRLVDFGVRIEIDPIRFRDMPLIREDELLGVREIVGVRTLRLIEGVRLNWRVGCCTERDFMEFPKLRLIDELPPRDEDLPLEPNLL